MDLSTIPFRLDRSRNATVQVFEHLRELIVSLAIPPGTVLARPQLCEYFRLSLSPVREALLRLEEEHLVDIYPQHQTQVRCIDLAQARQAHFLRLSVELEIAHVLAKQPDPVLGRELLGLTERQRACLEAGDLSTFTQLDMEFHRRMYEAAALPDLWLLNRSRSGNLDRLRRLHLPMNGKALSILEQHAQIAKSIGRGDPAAAQHTVRMHLGGTLNAIDALRERYPGLLLPADYPAPAADAVAAKANGNSAAA
jgi:DNA-binding GntR family transcriptional regulator